MAVVKLLLPLPLASYLYILTDTIFLGIFLGKMVAVPIMSANKKKLFLGIVIAFSSAIFVYTGFYFKVFEGLEFKTFDMRARYFRMGKEPTDRVAIVLIDETSLRVMNPIVGRWPWPREIHADLINFFALGGARAVVFDILFTENEKIQGMPSGIIGPNDAKLVEATKSAGNVYHAAQLLIDMEDEYNKNILKKPLPKDFVEKFAIRKEIRGVKAVENNNYYIPFPELYGASHGIGIVEFAPDNDGIYRRTKPFRYYQGSFFPVLPMAPLLDILDPASIRVDGRELILVNSRPSGEANTSPLQSDISIPLQKDDTYLINMYGGFKPYSMSGILASIQKIKLGEIENLPVTPDEFKEKVIFVGGSAVGIEDLKPTPLGGKIPGVFLHASTFSNIVKNDFLRYANPLIIFLSILFLSILTTLIILWIHNIIYQIILPLILTSIYISISFWWFNHNIVLDIVTPVISIAISWMGSFAYLSSTEGKDKRKIKRMLGQYVSPSILTSIMEKSSGEILKAEVGSKVRLTILFSDIKGFTSISEAYDAEKVVELLNGYLSRMVDVIFKHEGTLDKFIGDAILSFWGAPIRVDDHAKRAVETAMDMVSQLEIYNKTLEQKGLPQMGAGIGINTGEVILGNIGSEKKLDYTIIGDNVNITSRMEGLAKEYGCPLLITETTYMEVKDTIPCRIVDIVMVKGKKKGIKIYEPLKTEENQSELIKSIISLSEEGFDYYLNRDWDKAKERYTMLMSIKSGDSVSGIFINRCEQYIERAPPKEWDGVYIMLKK